jgi:hypothetical protein
MFFATNSQRDQEEDQVCGFVYLSFLSLQINFHSEVKFSFSFSFGKTCGYCHMITSAVENQNFEKSYNCDHCSLFHHIDKTLKGK